MQSCLLNLYESNKIQTITKHLPASDSRFTISWRHWSITQLHQTVSEPWCSVNAAKLSLSQPLTELPFLSHAEALSHSPNDSSQTTGVIHWLPITGHGPGENTAPGREQREQRAGQGGRGPGRLLLFLPLTWPPPGRHRLETLRRGMPGDQWWQVSQEQARRREKAVEKTLMRLCNWVCRGGFSLTQIRADAQICLMESGLQY